MIDDTKFTYTWSVNGNITYGVTITNKSSGKSIYLPVASMARGSSIPDPFFPDHGCYWSSSINTKSPVCADMVIKTGEEKIERRAPHVGALAGIVSNIYPDFSAGLAAGVTVGKWAVFLQARSNFRWQKTAYDCFSDGTADSGFFWSGEGRRVNRHNITLDVSYAIWKPVSVYAGAGYGVRTLCWEDYEGNWAKVADRSYGSAAVDAGLLIHPFRKEPARGLTFLVGGTWIHKNWFEAGLGLLWRF